MKKLPDKITVDAWVHLHRTHRKLLDAVEASLKQNELPSLNWYDVLLELRKAGAKGLRQYEIGERILLSKYNLSRLIDKLEKEQLVVRHSSEDDGRGYFVVITDLGKQLQREMWPVYGGTIQKEFGEKLNDDESSELVRLLSKILDKK